MPALTTAERAAFDNPRYPSVGYVYISQPELVFEATILQGYRQAKGVVALGYNTPSVGSHTDIEAEMTLEIWDSDFNRYGSQRVKSANATRILVGRSPVGNGLGELNPLNGATIKIYRERRAWSKIPYIAPNGTQYKDNEAYPGDNAAQPPVANAGADRLIVVAEGTTQATIPLDALGDVPSFAVRSGATLSSYSWDLDDGSVDTGTLSSSSLTATFPVGERYVSLTVTDSNGETHTAYLFVVVATQAQCLPVRIAEERITPEGVRWRFTVNADDLPSSVREGTKVLYTEHEDYSLSQVDVRFSGWLGPEDYSLTDARDQERSITITAYDIAERLRQLHGFPLTVEVSSGTTGWYRMPDANIDRFTHHYVQWHTNVLDLADFEWSGQGATYPLPRFTSDGATIWEQADRLARAIGYKLTCNTLGQLRVVGDPQILPTSSQAATFTLPTQRTATEVTTLTADDYGEYELPAARAPTVHWLRGSAVVASSSAANIGSVKAAAPSKTPGQGANTLNETEQLVTKQTELNARLANRYAARVNPRLTAATLEMVKTAHVFEPADMEWVRVTFPAGDRAKYPYLASGGDRYLIREIINTYDGERLAKNSTFTIEREFEGVVNDDMTIIEQPSPQSPDNPDTNYSDWEDDYVPLEAAEPVTQTIHGLPPIAGSGQGMVAILSNGRVAVTSDFDTASWNGGPTWTVHDHSATLGTNVLQFIRQAGQSAVTGWIVTDQKIFKIENAQNASPTITEELDFGYSSSYRNIDTDALFASGLFAVVASVDGSTVKETRTLDGGSTWGGETAHGSTPDGDTIYDFTSGDDQGWSAVENGDRDGTNEYDGIRPKAAEGAAGSIGASGWTTADYQQVESDRDVRAIFTQIVLGGAITIEDGKRVTAVFDYTPGALGASVPGVVLQTRDNAGDWTTRAELLSDEWWHEWDFTDSLHGWTILQDTDDRPELVTLGEFVSGQGIKAVFFDAPFPFDDIYQVNIELDIPDGVDINNTLIEFEFVTDQNTTGGTGTRVDQRVSLVNDSGSTTLRTWAVGSTANVVRLLIDDSLSNNVNTGTNAKLRINLQNNQESNPGLTAYLRRVRIGGTGTAPTWSGGVLVDADGGTDMELTWTATPDTDITGIAMILRSDDQTPRSGSGLLKTVTVEGQAIAVVPGLYVSTAVAGDIAAGLGIPAGGDTTPIYLSEAYSLTYATDTDIQDENGLLTGLLARAGNDGTYYYGYLAIGPASVNSAFNSSNNLLRGNPTDGEADITPVVGSVRYGPDWERSRNTIAVASGDDNVVSLIGADMARSKFAVFITNEAQTASPTWTELVSPGASVEYRRCLFSTNAAALIVFGLNGAIAYSDSPLNPDALDDRNGDLSTTAEIVGIQGF